jgi:hypothetical protein
MHVSCALVFRSPTRVATSYWSKKSQNNPFLSSRYSHEIWLIWRVTTASEVFFTLRFLQSSFHILMERCFAQDNTDYKLYQFTVPYSKNPLVYQHARNLLFKKSGESKTEKNHPERGPLNDSLCGNLISLTMLCPCSKVNILYCKMRD